VTEKEIAKLAELARRTEPVKTRADITPAVLQFAQEAKPGILGLVQEIRTQRQEIERLGRRAENGEAVWEKEKMEAGRQITQLREAGDLERAKARTMLRLFKVAWTAATDGFTLVQSSGALNKRLVGLPDFLARYGAEVRDEFSVLLQRLDAAQHSIGSVLDELDRSSKKGLVSDEVIEALTAETQMPLKVREKAPAPVVAAFEEMVCCPKCGNTSGPFQVMEERVVAIEYVSGGIEVKQIGKVRVDVKWVCSCGAEFLADKNVIVAEKGDRR